MPSRIPPEFELSFLIGEVVRNDVFAETEMRWLCSELVDANVLNERPQRDYGRLIRQVRVGLSTLAVPPAFRDLALQVIEAAAAAHRDRNQFAHDQWVQLRWSPETVRSSRGFESRTLDDLRRCAADLLRVTWRLRGLAVIAPHWLAANGPIEEDAAEVRSWTRVAMGHIDDTGSVLVGTPGPAVMPPA